VKELTVGAAADLSPALKDLGDSFERKTGIHLKFSFGASGALTQQIENGAPFDLFFSADMDYPRQLVRDGQADASTLYQYAVGKLVLWVAGSLLSDDWTFLHDTVGFMPGVVAGLLVFTASLTFLCILLSAIAGSPNLAMILWCLLLGGSWAVGEMVQSMSRTAGVGSRISLFDAAGALARALAGIPQRGVSIGGAAALLLGVAAVLAALARRRLRLQEAVG